jgi:peptidoglycan/LPS O-acetylase OafA/YrhL
LISTVLVFLLLLAALWRKRVDDVTLLLATVCLTLLGNAFICGVISGPHDRYGSRLVWITTFALMIAGMRYWQRDDIPNGRSRPA